MFFPTFSNLILNFAIRSSWSETQTAPIGSSKKRESSRKTSTSALLTMPKPLTVWITTNWGKFFKRWEYQTTWPATWEICMQVQEATVRTAHGTDWFQIGKKVRQGCKLSPCLFNFYAEYIMWNAELEEAQAVIKIAGTYINNLRYADDTRYGRKQRRIKEPLDEREKKRVKNLAENSTFRKLRSWHPVPSLHGK